MMTSKSIASHAATSAAQPVQPTDADFGSLIPVTFGRVGGVDGLVVDARQLHLSLCVGREFSKWISERLAEYEFLDGVDFEALKSSKMADQVSKPRAHGGDRRSEIVTLTLHTAKELAMLHRGPKGKLIRRYFIDCERRLLEKQPAPRESVDKSNAVIIGEIRFISKVTRHLQAQAKFEGYREFARVLGILGSTREKEAIELAHDVESRKVNELMDEFFANKAGNPDAQAADAIYKYILRIAPLKTAPKALKN